MTPDYPADPLKNMPPSERRLERSDLVFQTGAYGFYSFIFIGRTI